jgi:hypothetical protein
MKKSGLTMVLIFAGAILFGCAPGMQGGQSSWNRGGSWNGSGYGNGSVQQIIGEVLRGTQGYGQQQQYPQRQYPYGQQQQNCQKKFIDRVRDRSGRLYNRYEVICPQQQYRQRGYSDEQSQQHPYEQQYNQYYPQQ